MARDYVSWQNKLWKDGLIDQDITTEDDTTIKDKIYNDKCGISITSMGQMNIWNTEREADGKEAVWIGIPYPKSDNGEISSIFGPWYWHADDWSLPNRRMRRR